MFRCVDSGSLQLSVQLSTETTAVRQSPRRGRHMKSERIEIPTQTCRPLHNHQVSNMYCRFEKPSKQLRRGLKSCSTATAVVSNQCNAVWKAMSTAAANSRRDDQPVAAAAELLPTAARRPDAVIRAASLSRALHPTSLRYRQPNRECAEGVSCTAAQHQLPARAACSICKAA